MLTSEEKIFIEALIITKKKYKEIQLLFLQRFSKRVSLITLYKFKKEKLTVKNKRGPK
jgi:hypothetical protein